MAEQLVSWVGGNRLQVTQKGKRWVTDILIDESLMRPERDFLTGIGKSVTEIAAEELLNAKVSR